MRIESYRIDELTFAFCYRVYVRWDTHRRQRIGRLASLRVDTAQELVDPELHILECSATETDIRLLLSLRPTESVSVCASKLKGRLSKWLNAGEDREQIFSRGYFACTTGQNDSQAVARYLEGQPVHHGYAERINPPVFTRSYDDPDAPWLNAQHGTSLLRFHLCLATKHRESLFGDRSGEMISDRWRTIQVDSKFALLRISTLPDHVHAAIRIHPSVSPAEVVVLLMNSAQEVMVGHFSNELIRRAVPRVWQPSAYVGSFGDLESPKLRRYIRSSNAND